MMHRDTLASRLLKTRLQNANSRPLDAITRDAWRNRILGLWLYTTGATASAAASSGGTVNPPFNPRAVPPHSPEDAA